MEIIKLDHITKQYDDGFVALKDINLELESGKFYSLLGPSGSGKTTILRIIAGFTEASAGKVYFDGQDITNLDASKRHINTVFQNYALFPHLNVYENVAFALKLRRRPESEIREKVKDALHTVRLDGYANREISELSGGQQQRVAIARALANDPEILLSDEATSALDPQTTIQILDLLKKLNRELGLTIVLITHEMAAVKKIANKVAVMENGRVVENGNLRDVFLAPKAELTQKFVGGSLAVVDTLKSLNISLAENEALYQLVYSLNNVAKSIIIELYREVGVEASMLYGNVEVLADEPVGTLLVMVKGDADKQKATLKFLNDEGITVTELDERGNRL